MSRTIKLLLHVKINDKALKMFMDEWGLKKEPDINSLREMIKTIINSQMIYPFIRCLDVKPVEKTILDYV